MQPTRGIGSAVNQEASKQNTSQPLAHRTRRRWEASRQEISFPTRRSFVEHVTRRNSISSAISSIPQGAIVFNLSHCTINIGKDTDERLIALILEAIQRGRNGSTPNEEARDNQASDPKASGLNSDRDGSEHPEHGTTLGNASTNSTVDTAHESAEVLTEAINDASGTSIEIPQLTPVGVTPSLIPPPKATVTPPQPNHPNQLADSSTIEWACLYNIRDSGTIQHGAARLKKNSVMNLAR